MAISPLVQPLCLFLGTMGLVQGIIFFALTLLAVLVHLCTITVESDETLTRFIPLVVGLYFQGSDCQVYNTTILYNDVANLVKPEWLFIWMLIYLGVSAFWIIFSTLIMSDCIHKRKTLHYILPFWIILMIGICAMDLILAIYFGFDFTDLLDNIELNGTSLLPVVPFTIMILLLKGFVLWLINFIGSIFALFALNNFIQHKDDNKPLFLERAGFLDRSPIDAFAPIEMPRPMTLPLNSSLNIQNVPTVSSLRDYYLTHEERRSDFQSPISCTPTLDKWKKQTFWDIPDPDYSPTSTVTRLENETDSQSQSTELRHSLFNPTNLPLRPSLKKTQHNYERKEDISL